jgi:Flp pilus assembly protein TadG
VLRRIHAFSCNHRGQSTVEFALLVPVFLLLLFGITDFGRVMYQQMLVTEAAREGARAVGISGVGSDALTAANMFISNPSPTVSAQAGTVPASFNTVQVQVSSKVTIFTPLIGRIVTTQTSAPYTFTVTGTSSMRQETALISTYP